MKTRESSDLPCVELERISDYVAHHADLKPAAEALVLDDRRVSYLDLHREVEKCAKALIDAGVRKGDRVATLSPPHPDFLIVFLAAASVGAIWLGLNPKSTLNELRHVISDSKPSVIFSRIRIGSRDYTQDLSDLVSEYAFISHSVILDHDKSFEGANSYREFVRRGEVVSNETLYSARGAVHGLDPVLIVYTSGTTGKPKGAVIHHRGLIKCARVQNKYWNAEPLRILNFLPINHIGSVGDISCYTLVAGGTIVFMEKFDPAHLMDITQREKVTIWGGIPTTLQMCLALPNFSSYDLSSVQVIVWSGAAAPVDLIQRLAQISPSLSNAYGLTESVGSITFVAPCDNVEVLANTVGKPVPYYEVRIADPEGCALSVGQEGELQVRGDFIMLGYWNNPEATKQTIDADGWLHTGDVGVMREDGNVRLVGRLKDMFKSGGYNVYPREIEQVLEAHPSVAMAAVIGVPDRLYGEVGHAYVLLNPGQEVVIDELLLFCRKVLANYKVPKQISVARELPMLPIGKIDKGELRRRSSLTHNGGPAT